MNARLIKLKMCNKTDMWVAVIFATLARCEGLPIPHCLPRSYIQHGCERLNQIPNIRWAILLKDDTLLFVVVPHHSLHLPSVHNIQYTVYNTLYTILSEQRAAHTIQHKTKYTEYAHGTQCAVHNERYAICNTQYTYNIQRTMHSIHCAVYTTQYTVPSTQRVVCNTQ